MYHFIVNPNARSGLGQLVWNELEYILKSQNISYKVYFTKYQKHATKITQEINIGKLVYQNKSRNFAVSSGIGLDAAICHEAVVSKLKLLLNRLKLGKLTYAAIAMHRLFLTTPCEVSVTLDERKHLMFPSTYFVALMNNCCEGGGAKFCPKAEIDDDILDLIVVSNIPKLKILLLLPTAFFGLHTHFKGVHIYKCKNVTIDTAQPMPVHTDGEPVFLQHRVCASLLPEKIRVIRN